MSQKVGVIFLKKIRLLEFREELCGATWVGVDVIGYRWEKILWGGVLWNLV